MAMSKCPKCDGLLFEAVVKDNVYNYNRSLAFIQCRTCGCVVGVTYQQHIPSVLDLIKQKLGIRT
ncbi:hypothetical protein SOASR030_37500 [Leminorella grimontii]|uniref:Uncharacterized protein n=1 Tax=Leminorella grimontii TaxID=82981 RepID=A0AAV5N9I8_9GAMM|nr:hypothetical protein SOASR030_37500 [Leminorella grimontii]VFS54603.1 Uncharacterised protein [Leminorella grimontii]VFS55871.1 Uncharacterised protein [Leminorella grimontii]